MSGFDFLTGQSGSRMTLTDKSVFCIRSAFPQHIRADHAMTEIWRKSVAAYPRSICTDDSYVVKHGGIHDFLIREHKRTTMRYSKRLLRHSLTVTEENIAYF